MGAKTAYITSPVIEKLDHLSWIGQSRTRESLRLLPQRGAAIADGQRRRKDNVVRFSPGAAADPIHQQSDRLIHHRDDRVLSPRQRRL
jgi:hypothetical protein